MQLKQKFQVLELPQHQSDVQAMLNIQIILLQNHLQEWAVMQADFEKIV